METFLLACGAGGPFAGNEHKVLLFLVGLSFVVSGVALRLLKPSPIATRGKHAFEVLPPQTSSST